MAMTRWTVMECASLAITHFPITAEHHTALTGPARPGPLLQRWQQVYICRWETSASAGPVRPRTAGHPGHRLIHEDCGRLLKEK